MVETAQQTVNRIYREFKRYTGDGLPGEPTGALLPVGDPQSGPHHPKKSELRTAFMDVLGAAAADAGAAEQDADRAEVAAEAAVAALSSVSATSFPTRAAAEVYAPVVGPVFLRLEGYTAAGDGGGALYKKVASEPSHSGKISITLDDGVTVVWYELAETVIDPMMLGAVGFVGDSEAFKAVVAAQADSYTAIQAAINLISSRGGGLLRISRFHKSNTPLSVPYAVSIEGIGRDLCGIIKDSTTTKTVTYYGVAASELVGAYPGNLPTAANAVLILGGSFVDGRWTGSIKGVFLGGTLSTPGDYETWKVEFGILSVGAIAYDEIVENTIETVQRAITIPALWMTTIKNNHMWRCRSGLGIENGTSTELVANYANSCRDWGFAIRALKYSSVLSNGVDFLNDPSLFDDRTREASAYIFNTCTNVAIHNNGQEQTYGNGLVLDTLRYCSVRNNENIGIGSDYVGTGDIAVIKVYGALVGCEVYGNHGWDVKPTGLTSGGANPAKHHNLFQVGSIPLPATSFYNNIVRAVLAGLDTEAGWGNNNIQSALVTKDRLIVGMNRDGVTDLHRVLIRGYGSGTSTYALGVQNLSGSSLLELRDDGAMFALGVYTQTAGGSANVVVGSDGAMVRATSALKYKDIIGEIPDEVIDAVMSISGFIYTQKGEEGGREYVGLAADHFHDAGLHWFVQYGPENEVEGLMYDRIVAVLIEHGRRTSARIDALEEASRPA